VIQRGTEGETKAALLSLPTIHRATLGYEGWLGSQLRVARGDLRFKHAAMRETAFAFFRASFFRWAQGWKVWCPDLVTAPRVIGVGDLHIANFGTWRDQDGRLVWGVNDFDEAWPLPYTNDLLRLTTSALLAGREQGLALNDERVAGAILDGYTEALEMSGGPFVLAEHHEWLRELALARISDAKTFWQKLEACPTLAIRRLDGMARALRRAFPRAATRLRFVRRRSGLGSLGRPRVTALADYQGGKISRELKAIAPSACAWAEGRVGPRRRWQRRLLRNELRCGDPFVRLDRAWLLRRLAPDCRRIDLAGLLTGRDERRLLRAMGWETANVHLDSRRRKAILQDLARREVDWLCRAAQAAAGEVKRDFDAWRHG
jgi:Uncharacterized protein conserved in bacteria (DUF2252)